MTKEQLTKLIGQELSDKYFVPLTQTFAKYSIDSKLRQANFLAQVLHESNGLKVMSENLNYSTEGLLKTFPKYYTEVTAKLHARQPEKIANHVYANRGGNGNEMSGDGWRYRGRGAMQLTLKDNYAQFKKDTGIDVVTNPDMVANDPNVAILVAGWYWNKHTLNILADKDDVLAITRVVNGGVNGIVDRKAWLDKSKIALK